MNNVQIERNNGGILKITKGVVVSFIVTLISIFIFALILTYSNISEKIIPISIIILTFISVLIGSIISTRKINKNGMLNGGIIGGIYGIFLYLISSMINTGFQLNIYTILMVIAGIIAGLIGGIVGINS